MKIIPSKLKGTIDVIPSKSCLHRAIIAASLSNGKSIISNIILSEDIRATINGCINLGAKIDVYSDKLIVEGTKCINKNQIIDCNESGSTLRFMIPIFLTINNQVTFKGEKSLFNRPLDVYYEVFKKNNIKYELNDKLYIDGKLECDDYYIAGNISSQFLTGLLFSLPLLNGNSRIFVENLESKGYVDLTIDILRLYNIEIINKNYEEFIIRGNQEYTSFDYITEADYSQAAFYLVANELGSDIKINNLNPKSLQPDKKIIEDIKLIKLNRNIDLSENPDCGPILSVLASFYNTSFLNAKRLRIKECDRINAMVYNLNLLGARVTQEDDKMNFTSVNNLNFGSLKCFNDHRVCMAIAIASTVCSENIFIDNKDCVNKSYPNFWDDFKKIGGLYE